MVDILTEAKPVPDYHNQHMGQSKIINISSPSLFKKSG
jgi:hypothetical protein